MTTVVINEMDLEASIKAISSTVFNKVTCKNIVNKICWGVFWLTGSISLVGSFEKKLVYCSQKPVLLILVTIQN